MPLGCRRFVPKTLRACETAVKSHYPNIPNRSRSYDPGPSAWCQQNLVAMTTGGYETSDAPPLRTLALDPCFSDTHQGHQSGTFSCLVFDASILAFNKLTVNCAGIMTELCMLPRMNVANGEPGRSIFSRKRSPTDDC